VRVWGGSRPGRSPWFRREWSFGSSGGPSVLEGATSPSRRPFLLPGPSPRSAGHSSWSCRRPPIASGETWFPWRGPSSWWRYLAKRRSGSTSPWPPIGRWSTSGPRRRRSHLDRLLPL